MALFALPCAGLCLYAAAQHPVAPMLALSLLAGIPLGLWAGLKPRSLAGRVIGAASTLGFALPAFWLGLMLILVGAALVVVAVGLRNIASIFGPTFFALTLVVTFTPLRLKLTRWRVPGWASSAVMLVMIYAIILGILFGFGMSIAQLVQILPRYAGNFNALYTDSLVWLDERGVDTSNADLLLSQLDFNRIISVLQGVLDGLSSFGTIVFVLAMALAFLLVDSTAMDGRLASLRSYQPQLAACLADFGYRVRRYWVVNTLFGLIVAVLDTIVLMAIGVPLPLVSWCASMDDSDLLIWMPEKPSAATAWASF